MLAGAMTAVLYAIPTSHPCAAVERALQIKRVPYRRVEMIPGVHALQQRARFGAGSVPGIEFDDGTRVVGSRPIARRVIWAALRRAPGAIESYTEGARLPVPRVVARTSAPLVARTSQWRYG